MKVDLNCDMGEGFGPYAMGDDEAMLDVVTSANVACGWHAGDPTIMHRTAEMARARGVAIGAHPGFGDLWGFGRREIRGHSLADVERMVAYQVGAMGAMAALAGHRITYVKAHGALSNMANEDPDLALAVARGVAGVDRSLVHVCMPGLPMERASEALGLRVAREVFADRAYEDDGTLASRRKPGAVIHDPEEAARRTLAMVRDRVVTSLSGQAIPVEPDTVCVHGDTPGAVAMARRIRAALEGAGIGISPFAPA